MSSIGYAIALTDAIRAKVEAEAKNPTHLATTDDEIAEGQKARQEATDASAESALASLIANLDGSLSAIRGGDAAAKQDTSTSAETDGTATAKSAQVIPPVPTSAKDDAMKVVNAMKADGMRDSVKGLQDMAKSIGPIINEFDNILTKPYLDEYSAHINTVPVVGIRNNNEIMYIDTQIQSLPAGGTTDVWSSFGALPSGVQINPTGSDKVYLFPYKGDFCLSVGRQVWFKSHLDSKDPALAQAIDNWPGLYSKDWTKAGETVLPSNNPIAVVPFAVLSADRNQIAFHLFVLEADNTLKRLTTDSLNNASKWEVFPHQAKSGGPSTSPTFKKLAYWNNHFVGVDTNSNIWDVELDWNSGTYFVKDQQAIDPVTEFTATEVGPVGLRSDGYLYKRIIEVPTDPNNNNDAALKWTRWIKADGVTNLGVASPGVILDLNLLTRTLRSRYIDVQTAVYPVVDRIRAFGITHVYFLDKVKADAEAWQNAESQEQADIAIASAKSFISHAKQWATIVSRSVSGAKESVNLMTKQLHDVKMELETQLQILRDKLVMLQATLSQQQEALSQLQAAFWGSVVAAIIGLVALVAGIASGVALFILAAGALLVAGIAASIAYGIKMSELAADIEQTKSQINTVSTAIQNMSEIVTSFTSLDELYGNLNIFWGRMLNDSTAVGTMDEVTAMFIGEEILYDTSSIEASRDMTQNMTTACEVYLDVLNQQGVQIPERTAGYRSISVFAPAVGREQSLDRILEAATEAIKAGDVATYQKVMDLAVLVQSDDIASGQTLRASTGLWFDQNSLSSSSLVWKYSSNSFSQTTRSYTVINSVSISSQNKQVIERATGEMDGILNEIRPDVVDMLDNIVSMGDTVQGWISKYPELPTNESDINDFLTYHDRAVKACEKAQSRARAANNKFATFTRQAKEYEQGLKAEVTRKENDIKSAKAAAQAAENSLSPPWYVWLGGLLAVSIWYEVERAKIRDNLQRQLNELNSAISALEDLQSSGVFFKGHVLTWIEMTETVSGNLGSIYNILTGVWGQLLEDPVLYSELIKMEWGQVVDNAHRVKSLLNASSKTLGIDPKVREINVVEVVCPAAQLGPGIQEQAAAARECFKQIDVLLTLPFTQDVIGYWDNNNTERESLYNTIYRLRQQYVGIVSMEYSTMSSLQALAILQEYRANNVVDGKLSLAVFLKETLRSLRTAYEYAGRTSEEFGNAAEEFRAVLTVIDNNIAEIESKIDQLNTDIEDAEDELRNAIITIIADTLALAFAAAGILVAFGIIGPIAAAVTLAAQIGATASATAASIKLVLDSLKLSDIIQTISSLKSMRDMLQRNVNELQIVRPRFQKVVDGVVALADIINNMQDKLGQVVDDAELWEDIKLTVEDAKRIGQAWASVRESTQVWMDVINEQGIDTTTFSLLPAPSDKSNE
ncbi:hypothetical protein AX16_003506 [Volvariella volvacea WC 439]|nr:hypothetical protein AX16_003506 [Volvariella volvacea WC 439]